MLVKYECNKKAIKRHSQLFKAHDDRPLHNPFFRIYGEAGICAAFFEVLKFKIVKASANLFAKTAKSAADNYTRHIV